MVAGAAAAAGIAILRQTLHDPRASVRIPELFRESRSLNSRARREARERVYGVVRSHALLEAMLRASGWNGEDAGRALWLQLAVLHGHPAEEAAATGLARFDAHPYDVLPADPAQARALLASLPQWLAKQVDDQFALACGERAPLTVRVNPRLCTREDAARELAAFEPVFGTLSPFALHLNGQVRDTPAWRQGRIEVQDEGSQLIAELVRPPRRSRVLDYCAGAGGKALAIAATAPKRCTVHVYDVRSKALAQAVKRARRAGVTLSRELPDLAQRVLVDAPCTGSGTLRRDPARRFRLSEDYLREMVALQRTVLRAAADRVAPGGRLIYATCSVSPEENEGQLDWLRSALDWPVVPIKEVLGRERAEGIGEGGVLRVGPATHGTDGFYAVLLQRP